MRVLPSATTVTFFGVVTARVRPPRPSGWERDADSTAPSARMPRSFSALSTVVAVVQYSLVCAVDGDRQLAPVAHRDVVTVAHRGRRGREPRRRAGRRRCPACRGRRRRCEPRTWTEVGCPSTETCDGLVVVGDTDGTGGHDERGNALSGMTKGSSEQHKCSSGRAPRAPTSDVGRGRPDSPGTGLLRAFRRPPAPAAGGRVTRVVRGDPAPAIPSTVQDSRGEGQISVTVEWSVACPTGHISPHQPHPLRDLRHPVHDATPGTRHQGP